MEILTENPQIAALEYNLAKQIAETLHASYPGHLWGVNVNSEQGIATVTNLRLSGNWGFLLHLKDLKDDPTLKRVARAGGEILERYRLSRGRFRDDEYDALKTDHLGNFKADM